MPILWDGTTAVKQNGQHIAAGADARRQMRDRAMRKNRIAAHFQNEVIGARVLDAAFFDGLAEYAMRVMEQGR